MDEDLATILHWWDSLSDLERGTASWVVEALAARHQGLPTFPTDLSVDQVVAFIAVAASHGWHCDCCRWSQDSE